MASGSMEVFDLLGRMEKMVSNARGIPLSGKIMLEKEEFTALVRHLRDCIPVDLQTAKQVLEQEEAILSDSRRQAEETKQDATNKANRMLESATQQANAMVNDAADKANTKVSDATNQANAIVADAQALANATVADAQARARQMVSDSEIVARAQAEAQEMLESAHRECDAYSAQVQETVHQLLENADAALSQQLDSLRAMRQDLTAGQ